MDAKTKFSGAKAVADQLTATYLRSASRSPLQISFLVRMQAGDKNTATGASWAKIENNFGRAIVRGMIRERRSSQKWHNALL